MGDRMRWRYGDTNPVVAAVDANTVIEIGDALWHDVDDAKPATLLTDTGELEDNQELFAVTFLGIAMQRSRAGETTPIRVATTGVFEFDCAGDTFELGDPVALAPSATPHRLLNQQIVKTSTGTAAFGRVARREPSSATRVLVDVRSTVMTGGVIGSIPA